MLIALAIGVAAGSASALFLFLLERVTQYRETHLWVIGLLPMGGLAIGFLYQSIGESVRRGHALIIDEIHEPRSPIPLRMAPLVLIGTLATHFFGGSSGREGTAVQMGAALADQLHGPLQMKNEQRRMLLMCGLSAGFGSVFGTPLAGAVFGAEVFWTGRRSLSSIRYAALLPCLLASMIGNQVTLAWGIHHTVFPVRPDASFALSLVGVGCALAAGAVFGTVGTLFARTTHEVIRFFSKAIRYPAMRPFVGGVLVLAAVVLTEEKKFLGLGIPTMVAAFEQPLSFMDFIGKFFFTAVTLGSGFKGGEVTPLLFIGATLGNALAAILPLPFPLLAAMGFAAVFAGAAAIPLSSTFMAFELFGQEAGVYAGISCFVAFLFSGRTGIYHRGAV